MLDTKKILVVSDNMELVSFFKNECAVQKVDELYSIDYRYSAVNKAPGEMINLGLMPVDVNHPQFVKHAKNEYRLILSLHCKQIFPADLVASIASVNVHPGFNPHNRGWYPQVFSIINGKPIGATIHLMDEDVDHGEIIDQGSVDVMSSDTSLELYERVVELEKQLIKKNLLKIVNGEFSTTSPESNGNYNSIGDFKSLCKLNMDDKATLREHIDLLRALSHGEFKNAFFIDEQEKTIFVRVVLEE